MLLLLRLLLRQLFKSTQRPPLPPPAAPAAPLSEVERNMRRYGVPTPDLLDPAAPVTNLSPPRMRELATGGLLLTGWGLPLKQLVPVLPEKKEIIWTMLKRDWGIATAAELRSTMQRLLDSGHRATLQPQLAQNEAEWRAKFDEYEYLRGRPVRSVAGWDAGRIVCLAYWGLLIGMLDRDTAFGYMAQATELAQQHLHSWEEMAGSYLAGYVMWNPNGQERMAEYAACARTLLDHEQGVWRLLPWAGPLPIEFAQQPPATAATPGSGTSPELQKTLDYLEKYGVPDLDAFIENSGRETVLSPPARRVVATGAFLLYSWFYPSKRLVPARPAEIAKLRRMLASAWSLTSTQEAHQRLTDLYEEGHRAELQPRLAQNEAEWRAEFDKYPFLRDHAVTSVAAWDYGRIAAVAYMCLVAGYFDRDTAFQYMDKATRAAVERFNSWEEFAVSYLAGRCMWNPDDPEGLLGFIEMAEQHLTSRLRSWGTSPWENYTPWPWAGPGR